MKRKTPITLLAGWLAFVLAPGQTTSGAETRTAAPTQSTTHAQQTAGATGDLAGFVSNASTKASLGGATVELANTSRRTLTDSSGAFAFHGLAPGNYTVAVDYPGLDRQTQRVTIVAGEKMRLVVELMSDIYNLPEFNVTAEREGNAASIARQRNASNIVNVVAIDAFGDVADGNIGNFMQRLPGVAGSVNEGDVIGVMLRGAPPSLGMTMLDGSRMSGAASGDTGKVRDRAALIDRIPAEFIKEVEVIKASLPDMDASGLGGATKLVTKSAFDFREKTVASFQAGYNRNTYRDGSPWTPTGAFTLLSKLGANDKIGLTLSASYTATVVTRDQIEQTHLIAEPLTSGVRYLDDVFNRRRAGLGGKVEFRPSDTLSLFVDALYSTFTTNTDRTDFMSSQITGFLVADYNVVSRAAIEARATPRTTAGANAGIAPGATGQLVEVLNARATNRYGQDARNDKAYRVGVGGKKTWGATALSTRFGYTYNKYDRQFDQFQATLDAIGFTIDQRGGTKLPILTQTYGPSFRNLNNYIAQYSEAYQHHRNRMYDFEMDLQRGVNFELFNLRLKSGVKMTQERRNSDTYTVNWNAVGADRVQGVNPATGINDDNLQQFAVVDGYGMFDGHYQNFAGIDGGTIRKVYSNGSGYFQLRGAQTHNPPNKAQEDISAGYVLGEVTSGKLNVLGGVRVERTEVEATGILSGSGAVRQTTRDGDYTEYFPSVHTRYTLRPNLYARASYSTTMARPAIGDIIPATTVTSTNGGTVTQNNTDLGPQYSKNYDLMLEYYFTPVGVVSFGVFKKDISGFIAAFQDTIPSGANNGFNGDFAGFAYITMKNLADAEIQGYEINYDQQLRNLPKPFNTLTVFANYSRVHNKGTYDGGAGVLSGFIPSTFNVGFSYSVWRLQVRADYNHTGPHLFGGYNVDPVRMNMSTSSEKVNLNVQYKINSKLNATLNVANVFNTWPYLYSLNPTRVNGYDKYGTRITLGVACRL